MAFEPVGGDVIRFDYLWTAERERGQRQGTKDRPCAVVVVSRPRDDGSRRLMVAAITHAAPRDGEGGIEVPPRLRRALGLDAARSWIRTHEINVLTWAAGEVPHGVTPTASGAWTGGKLPEALTRRVLADIEERSRHRALSTVERDEAPSDASGRDRAAPPGAGGYRTSDATGAPPVGAGRDLSDPVERRAAWAALGRAFARRHGRTAAERRQLEAAFARRMDRAAARGELPPLPPVRDGARSAATGPAPAADKGSAREDEAERD